MPSSRSGRLSTLTNSWYGTAATNGSYSGHDPGWGRVRLIAEPGRRFSPVGPVVLAPCRPAWPLSLVSFLGIWCSASHRAVSQSRRIIERRLTEDDALDS